MAKKSILRCSSSSSCILFGSFSAARSIILCIEFVLISGCVCVCVCGARALLILLLLFLLLRFHSEFVGERNMEVVGFCELTIAIAKVVHVIQRIRKKNINWH